MPLPRPCRWLILLVPLLLGLGCETAPQRKPMDQPLDPGDAMQADEQMRDSTRRLLDERQIGQ